MDIKECTDDILSIGFHSCLLVKAWQEQVVQMKKSVLFVIRLCAATEELLEALIVFLTCHRRLPVALKYARFVFTARKKE